MRTAAEVKRSPATRAGEAPASRRARAGAKSEPAASGPLQASPSEPPAVAVTNVRMLRVDAGLYALRIGAITGNPGEIAGMTVPAAQISAPFAEDGNAVEIVASFPRKGPWLDKAGGTVILRSPTGGGLVIVTVYGGAEETSELSLDLQRLDAAGSGAEAAQSAVRPTGGPAQVATEEYRRNWEATFGARGGIS